MVFMIGPEVLNGVDCCFQNCLSCVKFKLALLIMKIGMFAINNSDMTYLVITGKKICRVGSLGKNDEQLPLRHCVVATTSNWISADCHGSLGRSSSTSRGSQVAMALALATTCYDIWAEKLISYSTTTSGILRFPCDGLSS